MRSKHVQQREGYPIPRSSIFPQFEEEIPTFIQYNSNFNVTGTAGVNINLLREYKYAVALKVKS